MNRFQEFMQGRYGFDKLGMFILIASFVLSVLGRLLWLRFTGLICTVLDIIFIYRFLSKKEYARSRENRVFLGLFDKVSAFFKRDRQNYNYHRCPVCGTRFTEPKSGRNTYTTKRVCPKCGNEF